MEVRPWSITVPSTSNQPSSLDSQHFGRVCSQFHCGTLLWPGSTGDICDRCLADREDCNASALSNPKDATSAYDATMAYAMAACFAPSPRHPLPSRPPYLLPSSLQESTQSFGAGIGIKQPGDNSVSVSNQGRRSVNLPSSTISIPLYNYNNLCHISNVNTLAEEQNRAHHQLCGACRAVIYVGTVCPHCRSDPAPVKEETGFERHDCLTEPKDIIAKSNLENGDDDLYTAVMSMILNPDENLDDDDMDMEGIELSYPEVTDNGAVEEPKLQPAEEGSSCLKGNLPPEKNPRDSNQGVIDLAQTFPNRKEIPRDTPRSLKLCSTMGCTGTILRESLATRCLECVRRDWKSKILKGHAGPGADDGKLSSENIERSISKKQKKKKTVTWADEVSHSPASQQNLEYKCAPGIKGLQPSGSKYGIHSADFPTIDDDLPAGLKFQVGKPPSPPAENQAPIKGLELNDPTTKSEDVSVSTEDLSALTSSSSTLVSGDDLQLDIDHSRDDNEPDKEIPSSDSQEADPRLLKREASPHSAPTKLTIRIPPRPGLYVQKCNSIRCEQRLPATYRWKLCMMCRARSRGYQRRRQNLQGRPSHPEDELLQSKISRNPLSSNLIDERKAKSIPDPSLVPSPYPQYKAFPNLLADFTVRFNDFLHAQSIFFLCNEADTRFNLAKAIFTFDAEYSIVALDFDIVGDKNVVDANVLKLKREIERMGRIQFSPKRYISILEGGGIAERFLCLKQAPVFMTVSDGQGVSTATYAKNMQGELEVAVVPDHSHPFLAGHRTIVRFQLLG